MNTWEGGPGPQLSPEEREACRPWIDSAFPHVSRPQVGKGPERDGLAQQLRGMLLGLAIGDSLGRSSEGRTPRSRRLRFGEIRDYLNRQGDTVIEAGLGVPTDDTQLTFFTVESLLHRGRLDPDDLARSFSRERIYGIGRTVRAFVRAYTDEGKPWWQAGQPSAGNGALMRITPVLLPWLWGVSEQPWEVRPHQP